MTQTFEEIIGQQAAVGAIRRMLDTDRLPHALLFHGPDAVGKGTLATILAATLLCEHPEEKACGACQGCSLVAAGNHPDLVRVRLEAKKESKRGGPPPEDPEELRKQIVVDQIREVTRMIGVAPRLAPRRVVLVDPADRMNAEAQNALLKTLEEPPDRSLMVLIAARPQALLATVRSRCFSLGLSALPAEQLAEALERRGVAAKEALQRAALAEGCPGRALTLDLDETRERRSSFLEMLESLSGGDPSGLPQMASKLAGRDETTLLAGLELIQALLRDASVAALSEPPQLVHADVRPRLERLGRTLGAARAAALVGSVDRVRFDLRLNLNRTIAAQSLLAAVAGGPLP